MSGFRKDHVHWSDIAQNWIAWARKPGHDAFWQFRKNFADFVGPGTGIALDVGCGEGRGSRLLAELGYDVTGIDPVADLVLAAREAATDSRSSYHIAPGNDVPFDNESFDLVLAYNVLMDVDDLAGTLDEIRRVLRKDGELVISIVHPFRDRGRFDGTAPDAPFVLTGSYFGERRFEGSEERDGLIMHFAGWSRPLEYYINALGKAGFGVSAMREPAPDQADRDMLKQWSRVPLFMWLKARPL